MDKKLIYLKDTPKLMVKFVKESTNDIILEVPSNPHEIHDFLKADYVTSVMRNTFGDDKFKAIGDIIVVIDQRFVLKQL